MRNNNINVYVLPVVFRDFVTNGRGNGGNIISYGPENSGKTCLLNPITTILMHLLTHPGCVIVKQELRVETLKARVEIQKCELGVQIHKLRAQTYELRVETCVLRLQMHQLQAQIHESLNL